MSPFPRESYRPLTPYAPDRRPIAIDLSDNTNRWGTHPAALSSIRAADPEDLTRYPSVYADRLREAIADRFDVPIECVATGCGSDDLLDSGFRAVCDPGEAVVYMPPTFSMIEIFARMNDLRAIPVTVEPVEPASGRDRPRTPRSTGTGEHGPLPDPRVLVDAALAGESRQGLIYICRPNNPTGDVQPREWVEALVAAAGPDGPVIFVDEAYADYADDSLIPLACKSDRTVVLRTLSKAYGLAGLRVGFAIGAPSVIVEMEKSRGPYKVSRIAERAATAALEDRDGWVRDVVALTRRERYYLIEALRERGLGPLSSSANFVLLPLPAAARGAEVITAALRDEGIAVRPFPGLPGLGDCIRISVGPRSEMTRFLDALARCLDRGDA